MLGEHKGLRICQVLPRLLCACQEICFNSSYLMTSSLLFYFNFCLDMDCCVISGLFDIRSSSVKNELSMLLIKCSMEENWHDRTAGALNLQARSDAGDCRARNNSPVANQWSKANLGAL